MAINYPVLSILSLVSRSLQPEYIASRVRLRDLHGRRSTFRKDIVV